VKFTAPQGFFCVLGDLLRLFFVLCNMHMTNVILNITYVIIAHKALDLSMKTAMIGCGRGR
jgi:hypothetical protein